MEDVKLSEEATRALVETVEHGAGLVTYWDEHSVKELVSNYYAKIKNDMLVITRLGFAAYAKLGRWPEVPGPTGPGARTLQDGAWLALKRVVERSPVSEADFEPRAMDELLRKAFVRRVNLFGAEQIIATGAGLAEYEAEHVRQGIVPVLRKGASAISQMAVTKIAESL